MKKLFIVSLILLFAAAVWSEDLGEVAKKEKARREALKKQGKKATVLTNQDVKNIKSSLGIESNTPVEEPPAVAEQPAATPSDSEQSAAVVQEPIENSDVELEELKRQKEELSKEIQDASESIQQSGVHSRNTGDQYREKRLKEEELKKVDAQIEELEKKKKEIPDQPEENN